MVRVREKLSESTLFSFEGTTSKEERISGDDSKEDPPVPIPNTEVKLLNVDDTWWATAWESRKLPELRARNPNRDRISCIYSFKRYSSLAQSVERMTVNHDVVGSSPTRGAKNKDTKGYPYFCIRIKGIRSE